MLSVGKYALTYLLLFAGLTAFGVGQTTKPATDSETQSQTKTGKETSAQRTRISFLGASITAGYGSKMTLARALGAVTEEDFAATDASNLLTFMNPDGMARTALPKALKAEPNVVVALDFLFWFVYGAKYQGYDERKASLDRGLAHLAKVEGPLFLGTLPHITDANRMMLGPGAVPTKEVLDRINQDVRSWAKDRKNITLMDVPGWLGALKSGGEVEVLGKKETFTRKEILLPDRLHLRRRGVIVAAALVAEELAQGKHLDRSRFVANISAAEKRADRVGTDLTLIVRGTNGKRSSQGRLVLDLDLSGLELTQLASLSSLAEYQRPLDLAAQNPVVIRGLPEAIFSLPAPTIWAFDGTLVSAPKTLRLKKGKRTTVILELAKGRQVLARLVDQKGEPIPGALVASATEAGARRVSMTQLDVDAEVFGDRSDEKGEARLEGLAPLEHRLVYRLPGEKVWKNGPRVSMDAKAVQEIVIRTR